MQITDETPMPWGKYKGVKMQDVPASYLIWVYDNGKFDNDMGHYLRENLDVFYEEIKRKENDR